MVKFLFGLCRFRTGAAKNHLLKKYLRLLESSIRAKDAYDMAYYNERVGDCYEKLEHQKHEDRLRDHEKAGAHYIEAAELYHGLGDHKKAGVIYEKGAKAFEELEEYGRAVRSDAHGLLVEIDVDAAGQRKGNDQWR